MQSLKVGSSGPEGASTTGLWGSILATFGMGSFGITAPIYFETSYSKEELVKKMEFFNTIKEVSNILENEEPAYFKVSPIQRKIVELTVENTYVENT